MAERCARCNKRLYWFKESKFYKGEEYCEKCYDLLSHESKIGIELNGGKIVEDKIEEKRDIPKRESRAEPTVDENDRGGAGWFILGLAFQLIGLVLFIVFSKKNPKRAKSILWGSITGFLLPFLVLGISALLEVF